jgi:pyruvate dehydrogenase (quinone)
MGSSVGDFIVQRLHDWGVRRIYGYPGDGINGITAGIRHANGAIDFVQVRHEETAAFAACGHAKYAGELGVCLATSGPGAIHMLNGLYDAKLDHQPVLAIVGQQPRTILGASYIQEVDLVALMGDVAGDYVQMATEPAQLRHLIDRAARTALAHRTVTCLIVPADLQEEDAVPAPPRKHAFTQSSVGLSTPRVVPAAEDLQRAADLLNAGERVAMLVGQGALGAAAEVRQVAELLGAGVAKALLGKAVLPDDEPWVTGAIGLVGTKASWHLMQECDTLLMVGTNLPYSDFLPEPGSARGVQIDIDGQRLGFRYPTELNLVGDSALTLEALIPLLERKVDRSWRERVEGWVAHWWEVVEARAMNPAEPINGQRVLWELSPRLPERTMISCDCGTATGWYARDVKLREGMSGWLSGNLLTMGTGIPYAIAAKFAHPDRPCVALVGDGAMQMNGMGELITVAKYWPRWSDPRLVILVLNNGDLSYVTWEQRAMVGDVRFDAAQDLPDVPYARYAELLGLGGIRVERPEDIAPAWDSALAADRPVVLDVVVDPNVPPLPPHITAAQAEAMTKSLLKGDEGRGAIVRQTLRDLVEEYVPHRSS